MLERGVGDARRISRREVDQQRDGTSGLLDPQLGDVDAGHAHRRGRGVVIDDGGHGGATGDGRVDGVREDQAERLVHFLDGVAGHRDRHGLGCLARREGEIAAGRGVVGARGRSVIGRGVVDGHVLGARCIEAHCEGGRGRAAAAFGDRDIGDREGRPVVVLDDSVWVAAHGVVGRIICAGDANLETLVRLHVRIAVDGEGDRCGRVAGGDDDRIHRSDVVGGRGGRVIDGHIGHGDGEVRRARKPELEREVSVANVALVTAGAVHAEDREPVVVVDLRLRFTVPWVVGHTIEGSDEDVEVLVGFDVRIAVDGDPEL